MGLKIRHSTDDLLEKGGVKGHPKGKGPELFCPADLSLFQAPPPTSPCHAFLETPIPISTFDFISKCILCLKLLNLVTTGSGILYSIGLLCLDYYHT